MADDLKPVPTGTIKNVGSIPRRPDGVSVTFTPQEKPKDQDQQNEGGAPNHGLTAFYKPSDSPANPAFGPGFHNFITGEKPIEERPLETKPAVRPAPEQGRPVDTPDPDPPPPPPHTLSDTALNAAASSGNYNPTHSGATVNRALAQFGYATPGTLIPTTGTPQFVSFTRANPADTIYFPIRNITAGQLYSLGALTRTSPITPPPPPPSQTVNLNDISSAAERFRTLLGYSGLTVPPPTRTPEQLVAAANQLSAGEQRLLGAAFSQDLQSTSDVRQLIQASGINVNNLPFPQNPNVQIDRSDAARVLNQALASAQPPVTFPISLAGFNGVVQSLFNQLPLTGNQTGVAQFLDLFQPQINVRDGLTGEVQRRSMRLSDINPVVFGLDTSLAIAAIARSIYHLNTGTSGTFTNLSEAGFRSIFPALQNNPQAMGVREPGKPPQPDEKPDTAEFGGGPTARTEDEPAEEAKRDLNADWEPLPRR